MRICESDCRRSFVRQLVTVAAGWPATALAIICLTWAAPAKAQQTGRIIGRVTSTESGAPIGEVQVYLPGTGLGSLTRQNGSFVILDVPAGPHELRAERIGLKAATQQVTVASGGAVTVNFTLATEALGLDEIVVTGTAGAARRREVGNTIAQVNVDEIRNQPREVTNLLQTAAPGIRVTGLSGVMGSGANIRLRGNATLSMSNDPIIYVDGIRMQSKPFSNPNSTFQFQTVAHPAGLTVSGGTVQVNPLNNINPADIERIEVIKGSAATTLYGTEASAGVIQIFTKKGSSGAPVWNVETQQQIMRTMKTGTDRFPYLRMDPFLKTGYVGVYTGSVRGGGQALQYFSSGKYEGGTGVMPSDTLGKVSARGNFTFTPLPELQLQWNTNYARQRQRNTPVGANPDGLTHNTYRGVANYLGSAHPDTIALLFAADVRQEVESFTTGGTVTYSPSANLTNRLSIGYDHSQQEVRNIRPYGFRQFTPGSIFNDNWTNRIVTLDYVGTIGFELMPSVRSSFSWGGQAVGEEENRLHGYGEGFPGAAAPTVNSAAKTLAYENRSRIWNAGFFFQNVFDVRNRYFLTLGARVDGNSTFGQDFGLQVYPKLSGSWVLSDESFWNEGWGSIKVRAAYGQSGRAPGAFDAVRTWNSLSLNALPALVPANIGNAQLGPEVTTEFETGFDGDWLGGRLSGNFTYYHQLTNDALFQVAQMPSLGFSSSQLTNVGQIRNVGTEISVNGSPIRAAQWGWDLGLTVTTNHSEVVKLANANKIAGTNFVGFKLPEQGEGWAIVGQPAPALTGKYVRNGDQVAMNGSQVATTVPTCTATTPAGAPCIEAFHVYGPVEPTLTWSPTTSIRGPGGVSMSARGEFRGGFYWPGAFVSGAVQRGAWVPECWDYYVNPYDDVANNYVTPNPKVFSVALKPDTPARWRAACSASTQATGITHAKADFFRLRNVSLQVPVDFAFPDRISNATLTLDMNNGWTWYNKEWISSDPEQQMGGFTVPWLGAGVLPAPTWSTVATLKVQF